MNYIKNEEGDVKVRHSITGVEKWLPVHVAEDQSLMTRQELEIVEAPTLFESAMKSASDDVESIKVDRRKKIVG